MWSFVLHPLCWHVPVGQACVQLQTRRLTRYSNLLWHEHRLRPGKHRLWGGGVHREKYMQCTQLSVRKSTEKKGEVSQIEHWGAVSFGESYNRKWDEEKGISAGSKTTRFKSSKQPSYPWERTWTREYRDGKDIRVNPLLSLSSSKSSFFLLG